jgi:hypothetical protein
MQDDEPFNHPYIHGSPIEGSVSFFLVLSMYFLLKGHYFPKIYLSACTSSTHSSTTSMSDLPKPLTGTFAVAEISRVFT